MAFTDPNRQMGLESHRIACNEDRVADQIERLRLLNFNVHERFP